MTSIEEYWSAESVAMRLWNRTPSPRSDDEVDEQLDRVEQQQKQQQGEEEECYSDGVDTQCFVQDNNSEVTRILPLVLSMRSLFLGGRTSDVKTSLLLVFKTELAEAILVSPNEKGLYANVVHSAAHEEMMSRGEQSSSSKGDTKDDFTDYTLKPCSNVELYRLVDERLRWLSVGEGPPFIDKEEEEKEPEPSNVGHYVEFTRLQILRLLWYVYCFGPEQASWCSIRRLAFPHQRYTITAARCEYEWNRLVSLAVGAQE
jgi:hypothetical protein